MKFEHVRTKAARWLVVSALLLTPAVLMADATNETPISSINLYGGSSLTPGALVVISPAQPANLQGCSYTGGAYVWISFSSSTAPTGRDIYASVLAALIAGQQVAFVTSGCDPTGAYPQVTTVTIY
jgi:hypothetical protein